MTKIKVLEMIDSPFLGGGQINLLSLVSSLDKSQFEVLVCSGEGGALVEAVKNRGITHIPISMTKKISRTTISEIVDMLSKHRIDVLHTHGGVAGFYGRWAARKCRIPVIVHTLHGIHYLHYRNIVLKCIYVFLEKWFARFTDTVIYVCDSDKDLGKKYGLVPERKTIVIRNGVDFLTFEKSSEGLTEEFDWGEEFGIDLSQPLIGTIARLHRQKGIPYLLEAARLLSQEIPGIQFLIVGGGPWKDRLTRQKNRLGLEATVHFLGERKDVPQLLSLFNVVVLSSLWEGLPYSLLEAGALSKPVVATDVNGVKEIIKDGKTGILVPARSPRKLAEALRKVIEDKELANRLGAALREDIQKKFSLFCMVEDVQNLYLRLLGEKNPRH
ncbi:MAG: glycosyltransferase family 4 protein [Candidatus Aminicenantes bacterium]|nr:glycosyltransferase family 4 protein [Candidatus Aminicenantes bacterium]